MTTSIIDVRTVAVAISDQERALSFYRDTLGFEVRHDSGPQSNYRWVEVSPSGGAVTIALTVNDQKRPCLTDTGIRFTVPDAIAERQALADRKVSVGDLLQWPGVPTMFTFDDPDGNRFYVLETT
jgi:catechol 2,3-dioxygenase-like lactoylglutathione lyase family enzyme